MKISSVSKKVLASALSAAMVVAFAPTVAFGAAQGDKITVNYHMGEGVVTGVGNQPISASKTLTAFGTPYGVELYTPVVVGDLIGEGKEFADLDAFKQTTNYYVRTSAADHGTVLDEVAYGTTGKVSFSAAIDTAKDTSLNGDITAAWTVYKKFAAATDIDPAKPAYVTVASGASNYYVGDYQFNNFVVDANHNGTIDTGENTTVAANGNLDVTAYENGDEIDLIATYKKPAISGTVASCVATEAGTLVFGGVSTNIKSANTYALTLSKDGTIVASANLAGSAVQSTLTAKFGQTAAKTNTADFAAGTVEFTTKLAAGTYTLALTDTTKTTPVAVSTADIQVIGVTATGNGGVFEKGTEYFASLEFMAVVGQTWDKALDNAGIKGVYTIASANDAHSANVDAEGRAFISLNAGSTAVTTGNNLAGTGDVKATQTSLVAKYATGINSLSYADRTITADIAASAVADSTKDYFVSFTSPAGVELSKTNIADSKTCSFGVVDPALGEYTVTLTSKVKAGASAGTVATVDTAKITLVKVAYNKGDGELKTGQTAPAAQIMASTDKIAKSATEAKGSVFEGKNGETFDKWTVAGAAVAYDKDGNFTVGTGEGYVVTLTATYKVTKAAKPTAAYADGILTLSQTDGDKYDIYFNAGGADTKYTGAGIVVDKAGASSVTAWVQPKDDATGTLKASDKVTFKGYTNAGSVTAVEGRADALLNVETASSTAAAPQYYRSVLTTAKADAANAIKAVGYATEKQWADAVTAEQKKILEAIVAHETAQLEAKAALAKSADGKTYSYVTEAERQAAVAAMAKVVADFDVNHDADTTNNVVKNNGITYSDTTAASSYGAAVSKAAKSAKVTTVDAAVAEPAIAAETALAAAKTAAEAEAALAQFEALTDAQKELVSASAVAAAQKIVLVATQDASAVKDVKGVNKTYKSKNGKLAATKTFKLKAVTSKSGAKATYKKANSAGKSKITVAKSGKVTVKKGLKKGKYSLKVKGTVGASTKTVTCKIVIK